MKKIFKWFLVGLAVMVIVLAAVSLYIYLTVDEEWIENRLEVSLSRKVTIEDIHFTPFSAVAGLRIDDAAISDRMDQDRIEQLSSVPGSETFIRMESGRLRFKILPLLSRTFDIREIVLVKPEIRIVRRPDGTFNFSDLLPAEETGTDLSIGRISISGGRASLIDRITRNSYEISGFDLSGEKSGSGLKIRSGFDIQARQLSGASFARDLYVDFEAEGLFESLLPQGRTNLPPFHFSIHTPKGRVEGFRIFERIKQIPVLKDYLGGLDFLGEDLEWEGGSLEISQRAGTVEFSDGEIKVQDYRFTYQGVIKNSGMMEITAVLSLPREMTERFEDILQTNLNDILGENLEKRISVAEVAQELVKPLTSDEGNIRLTFGIGGTPAEPKVRLIDPDLPDFGQALVRLVGEEARSSIRSLVESLADRISREWLKKKK